MLNIYAVALRGFKKYIIAHRRGINFIDPDRTRIFFSSDRIRKGGPYRYKTGGSLRTCRNFVGDTDSCADVTMARL